MEIGVPWTTVDPDARLTSYRLHPLSSLTARGATFVYQLLHLRTLFAHHLSAKNAALLVFYNRVDLGIADVIPIQ